MNPLGVHFLPTHQGRHHYDFIRAMQPGIFKLCGSSTPDVQQLADGYAAAPNALIYLRNVARSEQHDFLWREPEKAATQHVQEWHADINQWYRQAVDRDLTLPVTEQIRILGVNEPVIELFAREEDMSNYDEWLAMMMERTPLLDAYMVTFGLEANKYGYGAGLGNISSGQPANRKPGEYATFDWFPRTRKLLEATRGLNAYTCHEYWRAETGPEGHADWHAWRFMHLNVDCDIDILEDGVDQYITKDKKPIDPRGWHGHVDAAAYIDQHRRYLNRARTDSRFRCATPFTLDGDKMWESFWIEYCMPEMVALSNEMRHMQPTKPPPVSSGPAPAPAPGYVATPAEMFPAPKPGTVTATVLNVRSGPATDYPVLRQLKQGDAVTVSAAAGRPASTWLQIGSGEWVYDKYVSMDDDAPEQPSGDCWERAWPIVLQFEGGLSLDPNDIGNYYDGQLVGTKYGISAASWGGQYDIPNLTQEQALGIYKQHYFDAVGADDLPWPLCLAVFDHAVNAGVGSAKQLLAASGPDFLHFMAERIDWYTRLKQFDIYGRAWMRRCAGLLDDASK